MPEKTAALGERYVLGERIARGGMATVWKARDQVLARTVAVKILDGELSRDPDILTRFRAEAVAAARLTHPHVVAIYDTGEERNDDGEPQHFIVMEYCPGGTLADIIAGHGPLDPHRVVDVGRQILDALAYAEAHGVVHRDIKPGNVLIASDHILKVGDFGIAKAVFSHSDVTTTGNVLGTVTYLSPEQLRGEEPDTRSDMYSTGIVLYEALVGRVPFQKDTHVATAMSHLHDEPLPPRALRAGVPRDLEEVIVTALAKDPADRYDSPQEMWAALAASLSGTPRSAGSADRGEPVRIESPARWALPVAAVLILTAIVALTISALVERPTRQNDQGGGAGAGGAAPLQIAAASDFDPFGPGGTEHPEDVPLTFDGDPSTQWTTENYQASLELLDKAGVGLLFDLGTEVDVDRVTVHSSLPGYSFELRASDEQGPDHQAFDGIERIRDASETETIELDGVSARYWLVWITELPGNGGRAAISEVEFFGR